MTAPAGSREIALLRRLIEADELKPGELFVVVYTSGGIVIRHPGMSSDGADGDDAALLGLEAGRLLLVDRRTPNGRPQSFYLPSGAREELDDLVASAERAAKARAEEAAAAKALQDQRPRSLAEMLTAMIEAQTAAPGQFFTRYATNPHQSIGHPTWQKPLPIEYMELARLLHSGAVVQPDANSGAVLHLMPKARDVLAEEQRLLGEGPLPELEARVRRYDERRLAFAKKVGNAARVGVMVLALLFIALFALASVLLGSFAPLVIPIAIAAYEIITDGFGFSAISVADRAREAAERLALRELE